MKDLNFGMNEQLVRKVDAVGAQLRAEADRRATEKAAARARAIEGERRRAEGARREAMLSKLIDEGRRDCRDFFTDADAFRSTATQALAVTSAHAQSERQRVPRRRPTRLTGV